MSRTWPRPKGSRSKLNRVCPVCGTGRETGDLDSRVLGWPAHRTCAEWLGDWEPLRPVVHHGSTSTVAFAGKGAVTAAGGGGGSSNSNTVISVSGSPGAQVSVGDGNVADSAALGHLVALQEMFIDSEMRACAEQQTVWSESGTTDPLVLIANGIASADEVRERLDRQIAASFTVPPGVLEEHTHKAGDPLPSVRCGCGAVFAGTPGYLREAMEMHQQAGCRA